MYLRGRVMDFDYTRLAAEKYSEVRGKKKGSCILKRFIKIIAALCIFFIVFMIVFTLRKKEEKESILYGNAFEETIDWEGIEPYIAPNCGYEIENCVLYYNIPEEEGKEFKICYPRLIAHNGKDISAVNAGIRESAMLMAGKRFENDSSKPSGRLLYDGRYNTKWTKSTVNYVITYLDKDEISIVFQNKANFGSSGLEIYEMHTYVADINTGIRYQNVDLLKSSIYELADLIYNDMLLQYEDREGETTIFKEVLTPEAMVEALQTNGVIDEKYFMNTFLTKEGVGFLLSYHVAQEIDGSYTVMCGWTKTILKKEQVAEYMTEAPVWGEWLKWKKLYEEPKPYLKDINWEKFQNKLPKQEAETLQKYLPVLKGGEFTWLYRSFASDDEPHEPRQAVIQDVVDIGEPQEVMVDSIYFADVFQSGTQDIILFFPNIGHHYLILHEEDGIIYGIDFPVRWFQELQEDGLYCGSGGASYQRYFRMTFADGDFTVHHIATIDDCIFYLGDVKQGATDEESWELYLKWYEENTQNTVKGYNPFKVK